MASPSGECANCGKYATARCSRCIEGLDESLSPSATHYCSKTCQAANFEEHKAVCKVMNARKQLHRGAEMVQEVYYAFREVAFDSEPKQIQIVNGKLHIHLAMFKDGEPDFNKLPLYPFPKDALPNIGDKKALLVWNSCEDSVAYMHELLKKVFNGTVNNYGKCSPVEQSIVMRDEHKTIIRHYPDGTIENVRFQHVVLNVGLQVNDEHYIIDIAGAQFRQYRAVVPQKEYRDKYVMGDKKKNDFGYQNRRWARAVKDQNDPALIELDQRFMLIHDDVIKTLNKAVTAWETKAKKTVAGVLKQKEDAYQADKAALIKAINVEMQKCLNYWKAKPNRFRVETIMKKDLPKWKDEKAPKKKMTFGPDVPQDVRDFMEDQMRKGTKIINFSDMTANS